MKIGDLVYDRSICKYGIIVASKEWNLIGAKESEWEHEILYEDGMIDAAYEQELWREKELNENR
tara:strand:- start:252 stop:443 length:192 start_codon:yes stop_codon:yes gene_type:complete